MPRAGRTWLFLASFAGTLGLGAAGLFGTFPHWARTGGLLIAAAGAVLILWRVLPYATVKFDTRKDLVLKDGRPVARFAEIECVLLTQRGLGEDALYVVELRLADGALLFLGYTKEEIEASSAAAQISGAIGRPVEVAAG